MINSHGNINGKIWLLQNESESTESDKLSGEVFSGAAGYHFNKMVEECGLPLHDIYYHVYTDFQQCAQLVNVYRPPIILLCGEHKEPGHKSHSTTVKDFIPSVASKKKPFIVSLDKQAGSLLQSNLFSYPHYCIPIWPLQRIYEEWSYRDIYINLDLGKAKDELNYFHQHSCLQPLPSYSFVVEPSFAELHDYFFDKLFKTKIVCNDIETIGHTLRRNKKSKFFGHPGYFYVNGLAVSKTEALSYSMWDYDISELVQIWNWTNLLLQSVIIIGQNFFNFDLIVEEAYGFRPLQDKISDTFIRQHILWPELPRSLQFMVKQYTRCPYYKDEGKTWSPKNKKQYMRYNCLDCVNTFEVWEKQEGELNERPQLK